MREARLGEEEASGCEVLLRVYLERMGGRTGHHTEHSSFHCGKPIPRLAPTLTPAILVIATQFGLLDRSAEDSSREPAALQRVTRQGGLRPLPSKGSPPPSSSGARQDTGASCTPTGDSTPPPPEPSEEGGAAIASLREPGPSARRATHTHWLSVPSVLPPRLATATGSHRLHTASLRCPGATHTHHCGQASAAPESSRDGPAPARRRANGCGGTERASTPEETQPEQDSKILDFRNKT